MTKFEAAAVFLLLICGSNLILSDHQPGHNYTAASSEEAPGVAEKAGHWLDNAAETVGSGVKTGVAATGAFFAGGYKAAKDLVSTSLQVLWIFL